jgi:hypothetical protein
VKEDERDTNHNLDTNCLLITWSLVIQKNGCHTVYVNTQMMETNYN